MSKQLKVLIVEDSEDDALLMVRKLEREGYTVTYRRVCTARSMRKTLSEETFEAILADFAMPSFSAGAAMTLAKKMGVDVPFIIVSGAIGEDAAVAAMKSGAVDYVRKQNLSRLVPALERSLREARTQREHQRAEAALRENERRLSILMSNLPGMAYRCSDPATGSLEFVSEGCVALCGVKPEELMEGGGKSYRALIHPEDREGVAAQIEKALKSRRPFQLVYRLKGPSGLDKWVWEQGVGVFARRKLMAIEGFITDINDRKMAEESLKRTMADLAASRADLEQFAYIASHDLRAPLRAINNLVQWIEEDLEPHLEGDTHKNINLLKGRVKRMEKMIDDILEYARAGRLGVDLERVDTAEVLREIVDLLNPPEGFKVIISPRMPVFRTAKIPFQQVFSNLIDNAIKHHHSPRGRVVVSVIETRSFHEFTVSDDGPGIPEKHHAEIFRMFKTLKSRDQVEGTGVGLALVDKILERLGGEIRLLSSPGHGCTFRVRWPKTWQEEKEISTFF
jgi:PAS domain S-box-containing protein